MHTLILCRPSFAFKDAWNLMEFYILEGKNNWTELAKEYFNFHQDRKWKGFSYKKQVVTVEEQLLAVYLIKKVGTANG